MSYLYDELAAAYVRGMCPGVAGDADAGSLQDLGTAHGLKLNRFKRTQELPRVRAILGILSGLAPATLLDIGSGRGTFLWPLLDAFPSLTVTAVEVDPARARHLRAVEAGGIARLSVLDCDATGTGMPANSFDVVTVLEVLEHQEQPILMAREAVRLASRFVLATVPSKPDNNPEHIQLFTRETITSLMTDAGASSVKVDFVLNHIVAIAKV